MSILILNDHATITGGAAKVAISEAVGLANVGKKVHFWAGGNTFDPLLDHPNISVKLSAQEDPLTQLGASPIVALKGAFHNTFFVKMMKEWFDEINGEDPVEIAHIHAYSKILTGSVIEPLREMDLTRVLTLHDYFSACPNGGLYNYSTQANCGYTPLGMSCVFCSCDSRNMAFKMFRVLRQKRFQTDGIPTDIDGFIAVTDFSRRVLEPFLPIDRTITTLLNPIALDRYDVVDVAQNDVFLSSGRISPEKGMDIFALGCERAAVKGKIVGAGSQFEELKQRFTQLDFTGWLTGKDYIHAFSQARAFVMSSRWQEPEGLVYLEAAAHGIPIIAASNTAAEQFVREFDAGKVFPNGDVQALSQILKDISLNDTWVVEKGRNARLGLESQSRDMPTHIQNLLKIYAETIKIK
ncbi:MAG: glycosyltransferase family 4 protein [Terasakiella sp.]|uniref:glycosyltransferase family 4 protein n=1 Tax=unclassified Terasakiella TaxID=2614952 RepID=UPI003B001706